MTASVQLARSLCICLAAAACASAQTGSTVSPREDIVAQMALAQAANRTHLQPYVVTRDYRLFEGTNRDQAKSHVTAEITVAPPGSKKYIIENPTGSAWGERIVRKMLDGEVAFANDSGSIDITDKNYDFVLLRQDQLTGQRCYVLDLLPKRKSKNLLHGTIWIDAKTYLPLRVEGELAKTPSWWLTDVRVVLLYGYAGKLWVQTSSEVTASVRIIGPSSMVWQDVRYQLGEPAPVGSMAQTIIPAGEMTSDGQQ